MIEENYIEQLGLLVESLKLMTKDKVDTFYETRGEKEDYINVLKSIENLLSIHASAPIVIIAEMINSDKLDIGIRKHLKKGFVDLLKRLLNVLETTEIK